MKYKPICSVSNSLCSMKRYSEYFRIYNIKYEIHLVRNMYNANINIEQV